MRYVIAVAALAFLAGCANAPLDEAARNVCTRNGHQLGTPGFDACFSDTLRSLSIAISGR